ncbi:MAG: hypothetical protein IPH94_20495 [Saprospiraceae bacterium]|nr:hypothetical protein [Saprospiraceae bacterium]
MRYTLIICTFFAFHFSSSAQGLWKKVERFDHADRKEALITYLPKAYSSFELNYKSIQSELAQLPAERSGNGPVIELICLFQTEQPNLLLLFLHL